MDKSLPSIEAIAFLCEQQKNEPFKPHKNPCKIEWMNAFPLFIKSALKHWNCFLNKFISLKFIFFFCVNLSSKNKQVQYENNLIHWFINKATLALICVDVQWLGLIRLQSLSDVKYNIRFALNSALKFPENSIET